LKQDGDGHALVRSLQACPGVADVDVVFAEPTAT
jgi:hypothetical protein